MYILKNQISLWYSHPLQSPRELSNMVHFSVVKLQNWITTNFTYKVLGTIPTIGDALIALDKLTNVLNAKLKQILDISAELVNKDQIGLENIQEVGDPEY